MTPGAIKECFTVCLSAIYEKMPIGQTMDGIHAPERLSHEQVSHVKVHNCSLGAFLTPYGTSVQEQQMLYILIK